MGGCLVFGIVPLDIDDIAHRPIEETLVLLEVLDAALFVISYHLQVQFPIPPDPLLQSIVVVLDPFLQLFNVGIKHLLLDSHLIQLLGYFAMD